MPHIPEFPGCGCQADHHRNDATSTSGVAAQGSKPRPETLKEGEESFFLSLLLKNVRRNGVRMTDDVIWFSVAALTIMLGSRNRGVDKLSEATFIHSVDSDIVWVWGHGWCEKSCGCTSCLLMFLAIVVKRLVMMIVVISTLFEDRRSQDFVKEHVFWPNCWS